MLILAFDTTMGACTTAVVREGTVLAQTSATMDHGQAEALMPTIEDVMTRAGIAYADLDRIATTVGPGSFTGVRVGLATARALGLAAQKPVIGVSTLEVLAAAVPDAERTASKAILAAVDTKRGDLYVQLFDAENRPQGEPAALAPTDLPAFVGEGRVCVVGDGSGPAVAALKDAFVSTTDSFPSGAHIAALAATRSAEHNGPLPLYVLPPKVTLAPHGGRLRPQANDDTPALRS